MVTTQQFDRIRNSVTLVSYVILTCNGERAAQVKIVRPCRMRTGMESFTCLLETYSNGRHDAVIGKAGGCGYSKTTAAQANAIRAMGFNADKAETGFYNGAEAIAIGLGLAEGWRVIEIY